MILYALGHTYMQKILPRPIREQREIARASPRKSFGAAWNDQDVKDSNGESERCNSYCRVKRQMDSRLAVLPVKNADEFAQHTSGMLLHTTLHSRHGELIFFKKSFYFF